MSVNIVSPFSLAKPYTPPTSGQVVYLKPNAPGSGTTWSDQSGAGNHATLMGGATWGSGEIALNGTTGYIKIPGSASMRGMAGLTLCCWVRKATKDIKPCVWWTPNNHYNFREVSGALQFYLNTTSAKGTIGGTGSTGVHFYCARYDGATMAIYKDSVLVSGPVSKTGTVNDTSGGDVILGAEYNLGLNQNGGYKRFLMYNRALSEAEISVMYRGFMS
jgi:hypothetical protein